MKSLNTFGKLSNKIKNKYKIKYIVNLKKSKRLLKLKGK